MKKEKQKQLITLLDVLTPVNHGMKRVSHLIP